jgi:WD40 repeat protein
MATPAPQGQKITADTVAALAQGAALSQPGPAVYSVDISPDGQVVAAGFADGTIRLWNAADGTLLHTLAGHTAAVQSLAFSPTEDVLASGSDDATIRTWSVADGAPIDTLDHTLMARILRVTYSPNGKLLAAGGQMCAAELIQSWNGILRRTLPEPKCGRQSLKWVEAWGIAFTPDSEQIILGSGRLMDGGSIWRWGVEGVERPAILAGYALPVRDLALSSDGRTLAVTAVGGFLVWLRDAESGALLHELTGHAFRVNDLAFTPDGTLLVTASRDGTLRFWNVADGSPAGIVRLGWVDPLSFAISPDGRMLAVGLRDGTVSLWGIPGE